MSDINSGSKKNATLLVVLAMIFLVLGFFLINKFVLSGKSQGNGAAVTADVEISLDLNTFRVKALNNELFDDDKFKSLQDDDVRLKDVNKIKTGKNDPFARE